jgi:transcriptional regulator of acetoin/glycerol metabolism
MVVERVTKATLTIESEGPQTGARDGLFVRWVFPQPPPAPTWLAGSNTIFGRDAACTVQLESRYVSRQHAAIKRSGPLFIISDLGSKNGVAVNGRPAREDALSPGDVIRVGDFVGVCTLAPPDADLSSGLLAPGIHGGFRLRQAVQSLRELAPTDLPLVLEGQTGTGKETFARAAHEASGRPGPFRAVNCAVYSKEMAAAELFGYRKGAFTGAEAASIGHVRAAQGGTLLLDELTELAPDVQAMLLRVLENHEVLPLGDSKPVPVDVRFIAATQVPLATAVESGRLRADLRARLEGAVISLPPLNQSREIVLETFLTMFEQHAKPDEKMPPVVRADFAERLSLSPFPLNLRELDTIARRIAAYGRTNNVLDRRALDRALGPRPESHGPAADLVGNPPRRPKAPSYRPEDVQALTAALDRARGNLTEAAAAIGLSRAKAYRILRFEHALKTRRVSVGRA